MSPPGRLIGIGDVHGCVRELERLVGALVPNARDRLVFLGDYVDRGDASKQTIDFLLDLRAEFPRTVFLRGNHEGMLLAFLGFEGTRGEIFVRAGGAATLRSYGANPGAADASANLRARMGEDHVAFLRDGLVSWHQTKAWAFVHAGVRPGRPLAEQVPEDLLWIREDFLSKNHGLPQVVIYGHTPDRDVKFSRARRIGLDTGCVYGGRLSALDLSSRILHQIRREGSQVQSRDVGPQMERALAP